MKQPTIPGIGGALCGELILDHFCGGGGASEGIEAALGRSPDWAFNHDPASIQMHMANHPHTEHRCESIHAVDPRAVVAGRKVGLLWTSPACTHFSRARGSVPVSRQLRALGWTIPRWAAAVRPRVIIAENVSEWQTWGPVRHGRPLATRSGDYWRQLLAHFDRLGYAYEVAELDAADYGSATHRRRLLVITRCDGLPILWPEKTHGPGRANPYAPAAGCIDWSDLGASILHRSIPSVLRWIKPCLFVMLNPSTADATKDDPTIRRCIGFAKREGCTGMTVVNLFALRATDPKQIQAAQAMGKDPIGPDNWTHFTHEIEEHQRIGLIVAAWGAHPMASTMPVHHQRLRDSGALCLGMTKDGSPRHPLYVKADQPLIPWVLQAAKIDPPPLVKCNTCAHHTARGGCGHPNQDWNRKSDPDAQGRPWCHSGRPAAKAAP